jgi:hypothetical protein
MTMEGGGLPIDWAGLAPHIEHPTRQSIVEAIHWVGPLSAVDLMGVLDGPGLHLAYVAYHVTALVEKEVLVEIGQRSTGASIEKLYYFPFRK